MSVNLKLTSVVSAGPPMGVDVWELLGEVVR